MENPIPLQMTLRAVIELNVFNIIAKSGPQAHLTSKEIISQIPNASNSTLAAENLERMLKLLSVNSLLSTSLKPRNLTDESTVQETSYGLTKESLRFVPNEDGFSFGPRVLWNTEMFVLKSLSMLKYKVLEPESSSFVKANGKSLYEYTSNRPELLQLFNTVMGIGSYLYYDDKQMLEVYKGFEEMNELMDVGGGDGTSISKIVSRYPHIRGINFNLPGVIAHAPILQGVEHVSGDMLVSIPNTKAIMLMKVLHNWDDEHCKTILSNCWKALPEHGKVIVLEKIVMPAERDEVTPEMKRVLYLDVVMMALCGGKERTASEYDLLAKSTGFVEMKIFPLMNGSYVIELLKGGNVEEAK